jgi:hypothetical protein
MASPFFAPYIGANSYSIVVLGLCKLWSDHIKPKPNDQADRKERETTFPLEK